VKFELVEQAKNYLLDKIGATPECAVIMGSGLSAIDEILSGQQRIHYVSIPHFPIPKVEGHRGQVVFGKAGKRHVIVFEGRVHYYEGNTMAEVTFCTRVIGQLGTQRLILTNASGAINPDFTRGDLMLITDHINLIGANPLSGPNESRWGPRFLDQTEVYDSHLRKTFKTAGNDCGIRLREGVYAAMPGPTYETPAETRYLRAIGADAVGMSTVPEAIVARHMGIEVLGISCITNFAAGMLSQPLNHAEVLETAEKVGSRFVSLLNAIISRI